jgi:hypothetical protein
MPVVLLRAFLLTALFIFAVPVATADPADAIECAATSTDPLVDRGVACSTGCDASGNNVFPIVDWSVDCATGCDAGDVTPVVDWTLACAAQVVSSLPPV